MKANRFWYWLAWAVPKKLVYFCGIRLWCHATQGKHSGVIVGEVRMNAALKNWEDEDGKGY